MYELHPTMCEVDVRKFCALALELRVLRVELNPPVFEALFHLIHNSQLRFQSDICYKIRSVQTFKTQGVIFRRKHSEQ